MPPLVRVKAYGGLPPPLDQPALEGEPNSKVWDDDDAVLPRSCNPTSSSRRNLLERGKPPRLQGVSFAEHSTAPHEMRSRNRSMQQALEAESMPTRALAWSFWQGGRSFFEGVGARVKPFSSGARTRRHTPQPTLTALRRAV